MVVYNAVLIFSVVHLVLEQSSTFYLNNLEFAQPCDT